MKKLKINIKKGSLALIFLILMLAIMQQTSMVSAITKTYGPPYYKFYYAADNFNLLEPHNYAECWYSDTNVYGAEVHVGENFFFRRWVHLGVSKDITATISRTVKLVANFRIAGYLWAEAPGDARLQVYIGLYRWVGYWSSVGSWEAVNYYVEYGESMSFGGSNIHFTGPAFSMSSGTYRLYFNVYGVSMCGFFCKSSSELYEPGKIYFDSIGYEYGGGGGGCPILSVFNGEEYIEEGLLDIHVEEGGDDIIREYQLIINPEPVKGKYLLRLTEHHKTHSYIDQVQFMAKLENGKEIFLPLVSAIHSDDGNVKRELSFSDDFKTDIIGADLNEGSSEYIDLAFVALPGLKIVEFTFIIEGHNYIVK